ncbi:MAG: hypothetical protein ACLFPN_01145 [Methanomassiliicoccales archaeon]
MENREQLERRLASLREELDTLERSRPAHSTSPEFEMRIERIMDEIDRIRLLLE